MMRYISVLQAVEPAEAKVTVPTSQVDATTLNGLGEQDCRRLLVRRKRELAEDMETASGCRTAIPWLAGAVQKLIAESKKPVQRSCRVVRQQYELYEAGLVFAQYVYEGVSYDLWLIGKAMAVEGTSPFAKFVSALLDEAVRAWGAGNKAISEKYVYQAACVAAKDAASRRELDSRAPALPPPLQKLCSRKTT